MTRAEKAERIAALLAARYPDPPIPLHHDDPFTLLVAVLLSAQTTDERVNQVTPGLFARARTPEAMAKLPVAEILQAIRSCGLAPAKAKNIRALSEILVREHGGRVPDDLAALEALPGVGHKTASVVLAQAFGVPTFPVDTHIHRLSTNIGFTRSRVVNWKAAEEITNALAELDPNDPVGYDFALCHLGMAQGCPSRKDARLCEGCGVRPICLHWK